MKGNSPLSTFFEEEAEIMLSLWLNPCWFFLLGGLGGPDKSAAGLSVLGTGSKGLGWTEKTVYVIQRTPIIVGVSAIKL